MVVQHAADIDRRAEVAASADASLPAAPEPGPGVGDLAPGLLREWGPLLKPVGLGLLTALHSFEETTPGHPFFGWAHCTQTALAAYLDTSQDTIARYTNLLLVCSLIRVDEVETSRGKQKLYRAARGLVLPALGLLEHLIFDADSWTRKHTAWLLDGFPALGGETELARLLAAMRRAYTTARDAKGLAVLTQGRRLTAPGAFLPRRAAATQPALPNGECGMRNVESDVSAPCGVAPRQDGSSDRSASRGAGMGEARPPHDADLPPSLRPALPVAARSEAPMKVSDPHHAEGPGTVGNTSSAPGGVGNTATVGSPQQAESRADRGGEGSAASGVGEGRESATSGVDLLRESAASGAGGESAAPPGAKSGEESAPGGVGANAPNVIVIRSVSNDSYNENVNAGRAADADPAGVPDLDPEALIAWAARVLGDHHSLEWHRQLLQEVGPARYRAALEATRRAVLRGTVARAGAYFTGVLKRGAGVGNRAPGVRGRESGVEGYGLAAGAALDVSQREADGGGDAPMPISASVAASAPGVQAASATGTDDLWRVWQAATLVLRAQAPGADLHRALRYAVLLELDPVAGWALLGVPNAGLRDQLQARVTGAISDALGQVTGGRIRVAVTLLAGGGRLSAPPPTLADVLRGMSNEQ